METFVVTEDHLKLMRRMVVGWGGGEYGAPAISCKRPYGNSDVPGDVSEILGWPKRNEDYEFPPGQQERCEAIHKETAKALQVVLSAGRFEAGLYVSRKYGEWEISDRA